MAKGQLDQRQRDFCFYYVQHGKKQQAAIDAGYAEKSAHVTASRLLKIAKIQEEIKLQFTAKHMGPEEVMAGLADIARLDMGDFSSVKKNGGAALDLHKAKRANKLGLIRELQTETSTRRYTNDDGDEKEIVEVTQTKVKLYDKQRALETIARHHGLLKDTEINITINIHLELISQTWAALEDAGIDPVKTMQGLKQLAHDRITNRPSSN